MRNYRILLVVLVALLAFSAAYAVTQDEDEDGDVQVAIQDLPAAVRATLLQVAGTGTIEDLEKEASGIYSADVIKDGVKYGVEIAADGKLLENEIDKDGDEKDDAEAKEDDEGDVTVTLDQLPAAVAETIKKEAGSGTIGKIEKETEEGKTIYSAEITKDGRTLEVEVAPDGKLLKVEEDD